tara:strand:- start:9509 stop:9826 length:318 start_codon:yes stop_codon:yes gene_type:complete
MPTYTFLNKKTGKEYDEFMSIASKEKYLKDNSHISQQLTPIAIVGDHLMGVGPKPDNGFKENMSRIAEAHPNSPLAQKYGVHETNKRIKVRDTVNKLIQKKRINK